jgi:cell wall assembly regulator SMI1
MIVEPLGDNLSRVRDILARSGFLVSALDIGPPVTRSEIQRAEALAGVAFPAPLVEILLAQAGRIDFSWEDVDGKLPPDLRRGCVRLPAPMELARSFISQVEYAREAAAHAAAGDERYEAVARDWPRWLPVFQFASGDAFCIELSTATSAGGRIIFLEHDAMDLGPDLHGLLLAADMQSLVAKWSDVLFAELSDWSLGVGDQGIDPSLAMFSGTRAFATKIGR